MHSFAGGTDGSHPYAGVTLDAAGNLYGTTYAGGTFDEGVIYKIDAGGQESVLFNFVAANAGEKPEAGVILDSAGNLYGTASAGGTFGYGTVYKLDLSGVLTVLYTFTGGQDGGVPYAGVILDSAGNLYGTTFVGGASANGTVYKIDTTGHQSVLYSFTAGADGGEPIGGVIRDSAGNLYGTTAYGGIVSGNAGAGVVYKLDTTGQETVLYSFTGGADGANPYASLLRDSAGRLFGTTIAGGQLGTGTVFVVTP